MQAELTRAGRTFAKYRPVRRATGGSTSAASFSFSAGQAGSARFGSAAAPLALQVSWCCGLGLKLLTTFDTKEASCQPSSTWLHGGE